MPSFLEFLFLINEIKKGPSWEYYLGAQNAYISEYKLLQIIFGSTIKV